MARRLRSLLPIDPPVERILELGCGTGHFTRELLRAFPDSRLTVTDLAPSMLGFCADHLDEFDRQRVDLRILDARLPEVDQEFDLVASSSVVQWFPDLGGHFQACFRLLAPGGVLAVSAFCKTNFPELDSLLSAPPWDFPEPPGHFLVDACRLARESGFEILVSEEDSVESIYASAREFLRAIGQAGASRAPREGRSMTRNLLVQLLETYDRSFAVGQGVRATWRPWFLVLRKEPKV
ncbi:MAG: methyltransferase domain-containing protein [Fibrobacteria bacterium]|nr:methyltransferase domain-containing protein [Fibrobacteria bacterium]